MVAESSQWTMPSTFHIAPAGSKMKRQACGRMVLWVDAVGGFLVCGSDKVVIGQAMPAAGVDVPIQADISRRHVTIRRDGEAYLIVPAAPTWVDNREVNGAAVLRDGCTIQLGSRVRMIFRQPHPLSPTAKLSMLSHHRLQPAVDGVILMSEALILGSKANCHIVARDVEKEVIMFRREGNWMCRAGGELEIDDVHYDNEGPIEAGSRVVGKDFCLSLETA